MDDFGADRRCTSRRIFGWTSSALRGGHQCPNRRPLPGGEAYIALAWNGGFGTHIGLSQDDLYRRASRPIEASLLTRQGSALDPELPFTLNPMKGR